MQEEDIYEEEIYFMEHKYILWNIQNDNCECEINVLEALRQVFK